MASLLDTVFKMIGLTISFVIARLLFRESIEAQLKDNLYFKTSQYGAKLYPMRMVLVIKFMLIPAFLKVYILAMLRISMFDFSVPNFFVCLINSFVWIAIGRSIHTI